MKKSLLRKKKKKKLTLVQCLERQLPPAPGGDEVCGGEGVQGVVSVGVRG